MMNMKVVRTKQQRSSRDLRLAYTERLVQKLGRVQMMLEEPGMKVQLKRTVLGGEDPAASKIRPATGARVFRADVATMRDRRGKTTRSGGGGW
jgi:hypothetical protein